MLTMLTVLKLTFNHVIYLFFRDKKLKVNVDIVFIHGLLGGPFKTWRQDDRMRTKLTDDDDPYTYFWPKVSLVMIHIKLTV